MKKLLTLIFLLSALNIVAQKEANIWYFGENAGLNFNSGSAVALTNGELNTREGCASISDRNGNLLFYSDGTTVWSSNHSIMQNGQGLLGNASSTQSAIIVPHPGNPAHFFLFTVGAELDDGVSGSGFNYYIVDISKNNGLGEVIKGPVDLAQGRSSQWSEKVAAIKGDECNTFWVVSYVVNEFYAYKITPLGIASLPIRSPVPFNTDGKRGYLKISPDGEKLAIAHMGSEAFLLYDFNDVTGKVTNGKKLQLIAPTNKPYGVEFSANSEKLYVVASNDFRTDDINPSSHLSTLYQFDLSFPTNDEVIASRVIIDTKNGYRGGLQLGPDQKIYRALSESYFTGMSYLGVIENPENDGLACNYKHVGIMLEGKFSSQGLPPFLASIFSQIEIKGVASNGSSSVINDQIISLCTGDSFEITSAPLTGSSTYSWYYNNDLTPFSTSPSLPFPNVTDADNGNYLLIVESKDECGVISTLEGEFSLVATELPVIQSSLMLKQCDEDGIADGFTDFNLDEANEYFTHGDPSLLVTYHLTPIDANNGLNNINASPFLNKTQNTVYARIENTNGCHRTAQLNLLVSATSFPIDYSKTMTQCDDDEIIDGLNLFDLSLNDNEIVNIFPSGQNLGVSYYRNINDAQLEENEILKDQSYLSETAFEQTLYVRVESMDNGACFGFGPYLNLVVNPRPEFELDTSAIYCQNLSPITITTYDPTSNFTYEWMDQNGAIISTLPDAIISKEGTYIVIATSSNGCASFPQKINIVPSNIATITENDISIVDDTTNNSITIETNNLGPGEYEFALNNIVGIYQDEPFFENILPGIYTVFIRDKKNCGITHIVIPVIGYPHFFTPNNDGVNDTWKVLGVNENFYVSSKILIFDRFGKLITRIDLKGEGWTGIFNGQYLPATDYWFSVELIDNKGNIRLKKGHFSLIR